MLSSILTRNFQAVLFAVAVGSLPSGNAIPRSVESQKSTKDPKALELYYETRGAGAPVVLLHGFGGNIYTWRHLVEPISNDHEVFMIDLKGFGKSPKPRDKRYEVQDQANLIFEFIVAHKLTNLTLVGHSYGGGVALVTALRLINERPNCLKRLVLIDAAAYEQDLPSFIDVLRTPVLGPLVTSLLSDKQKVRMILKKAYYDDSRITNDQVSAYAKPLKLDGGIYALIQTARAIVPRNIKQISARYKEIDIPTLILWGRQDKIVPMQIAEKLHSDIPGSVLVVVEKCGHMPHEEKPQDAIVAIVSFLKAHSTNDKLSSPK
jgi:pimeloyl-ACP methyl ester carboxylesterase